MIWRNPNEPHLVQTDSYPAVHCANYSENGRRCARLIADAGFLVRLYRPWVTDVHAMDLAVDRERLVDIFRD